MSEAPERIWAFPKKDWFNAGASTHKITTAGAKDVEYVRADLVEAKLAKAVNGFKDVIGMLDDPHGGEHVRDMRGATLIARKALAELIGEDRG
jgi:hypothetical protein